MISCPRLLADLCGYEASLIQKYTPGSIHLSCAHDVLSFKVLMLLARPG